VRQEKVFKGSERTLYAFGGALGKRVSHAANREIAEHSHDWPNLTIHLLGECQEDTEEGCFGLKGPSVIFHPAGSPHANRIGIAGLQTIGILFDPAWLGSQGSMLLNDRPMHWQGGAVGAAARILATAWLQRSSTERQLSRSLSCFMEHLREPPASWQPSWLPSVLEELNRQPAPSTSALACRLNLNQAWLAHAYRRATGEGLHETARRAQVLRAVNALQTSERPLVDVAMLSGFCDQPHMNRCFQEVLGQTPASFRSSQAFEA
jgi:AraC family transcriptional regulator